MVWAVSLLSAELSPDVLTAKIQLNGIRSLLRVGILAAPFLYRALPPLINSLTLALKLFRGEPAISEFDWHFTANHTSSEQFAACYGSALHVVLPTLQPAMVRSPGFGSNS
jgi:hypothetical protein